MIEPPRDKRVHGKFFQGIRRVFLLIPLIIIFIIAGGMFLFERVYDGKIFPGVRIGANDGAIDLGGLSFQAAEKLARRRTEGFTALRFSLADGKKEARIPLVEIPLFGVDIAREIVSFDVQKSILEAKAVGRRFPRFWQNFWEQMVVWRFGRSIPLATRMNQELVLERLKKEFASDEIPPKDAMFQWVNGHLALARDQMGRELDFISAVELARKQLEQGEIRDNRLLFHTVQPRVTIENLKVLRPAVEGFLNLAPLHITYKEFFWRIEQPQLLAWFFFVKDPNTGDLVLRLNESVVNTWFDTIEPEVKQDPKPARWQIENGKVSIFSKEQYGETLDRILSDGNIEQALLREHKNTVVLVGKAVAPDITLQDLNGLGVVEPLAIGKTSFVGSPANRRHNLRRGTESLHGILIRPGEVFSLINTLGAIDGENGYLPELVILGDHTIPEYGGGLCQVSTTLFRAVLEAGLPVVERQNHSYRVSYYEPPVGMDATIYAPKPDFRFQNDYTTSLLLQTRVDGDNLIYELYGKKDGRKAEMTTPKIFNVVEPLPTKYVETDEIPVGKTKCVERSHKGADASFTYTVAYADGAVKTQVFNSRYRPWQEVCLVGKEKAVEQPLQAPSSTEVIE